MPQSPAKICDPPDAGRVPTATNFEQYRAYLSGLAGGAWPEAYHRRTSPSDLVQDTLVRAVRASHRYSGTSEGELRAWLKKILKHVIFNEARRLRTQSRSLQRECSADSVPLQHRGSSISADMLRAELRLVLEAALGRLQPVHAAVLRLREYHGLEYHEIGARVGKSSEAVRKIWGRAVAALEVELRDYVGDVRFE